MGFREFSHYFREIIQALRESDDDKARECLAALAWRERADAFTPAEVARVSIESGLRDLAPSRIRTDRGVRRARTRRRDALPDRGDSERALGTAARPRVRRLRRVRAARFLLARLAARAAHGRELRDRRQLRGRGLLLAHAGVPAAGVDDALLLASGGGAIGVRLGDGPAREEATCSSGRSSGLGDEADVDYMQSAVGLLWRALVLWLFLIFIVTVAHSLG